MTNRVRLSTTWFPAVCLAGFLATGNFGEGADASHAVATTPLKAISFIIDGTLGEPARYGIRNLEAALRSKGIVVTEGPERVPDSDSVILVGVGRGQGAATSALKALGVPLPIGAEALCVRTGARFQGKPALVLAGSDDTGLMYAALDLAERVGWAERDMNPFQFVQDAAESPRLADRGLVMFTMNRAYFESRLHDQQFWTRYLDMMAKDRFNRLVLVFGYENGGYMAPLYPYFFDVNGFPEVRVEGLTPDQQDKNLNALKTMLRLAAERGIRVKPGIWDHIYRGGVQAGAIPGAWNGTRPAPGFVWGLNTTNLVPYTVAALKQFYETFPEFTETQFRMHEESGLRKAEIEPFWHAVFGFFRTNQPNLKLELRVKNLPRSVIKDAQGQGLNIVLDTKFWMEQMGLPFHPTHINRQNQMDARQSYADLLDYPQTYHMNWTLWNGGTTRVLLWSDPDYARRLALSARLYDGQSLTVTEMEATKMLGAAHDTKPCDFLNARYRYFDYEFERYWAFYRVLGRLAYDPQSSPEVWTREYVARFGGEAGPHVMKAVELASRVLPRVTAASIPYSMFPTTMGWPEMMHMGSLPKYAREEEGSDIQQFMNVREGAESILQGTDTAMRRPEETSRWFAETSDAILEEVAAAERAFAWLKNTNEFKATMADAKILAALARYHSWRQLGGVNYNLYTLSGDPAAYRAAIADEQKAVRAWHDLVSAAGDFYSTNLWFGPTGRAFPHHWQQEMKALDTEFEDLLQAATVRSNATLARIAQRGANPGWPGVTLVQRPPAPAVPGRDYVVQVKADAPEGVKWIRLRYRHVNQTEDYQTAEMALDAKSGLYSAKIPASFIEPRWDLMFFVEIVDRRNNGRIYPDLDVETPYVVVGVKR